MIDIRCKTCIWWDNQHYSVEAMINLIKEVPDYLKKNNPGICRKHKPGAININKIFYGVQPIMDAEEFCGEHRKASN